MSNNKEKKYELSKQDYEETYLLEVDYYIWCIEARDDYWVDYND